MFSHAFYDIFPFLLPFGVFRLFGCPCILYYSNQTNLNTFVYILTDEEKILRKVLQAFGETIRGCFFFCERNELTMKMLYWKFHFDSSKIN